LEVAREAARLLYIGVAEEYLQAKEMAVASLGLKAVPSNYEIAVELDRLADEVEGIERHQRIVGMRMTALEVMRKLQAFSPRLIGSVWRGTARRGSDVDIVAFAQNPGELESPLKEYKIKERGEVTFKRGVHAYHLKLQVGIDEVEVIVKTPSDFTKDRCDIYGDVKCGITQRELERLLKADPLRKFVPRRHSR
jgi:predicted nucleotidyltransferase